MCAAFLPPCAPHFDGRATVHRLLKHRNPRSATLFALKMRSPNCSTFGKNHGVFGRKSRNSVSDTFRTNPEANHKSAVHCLIKLQHTNVINCCILLYCTLMYYIYYSLFTLSWPRFESGSLCNGGMLILRIYGMGHKKVPVFCKTTTVQRKFCVPFPCPFRSTYYRVYFCCMGKIIFKHVER